MITDRLICHASGDFSKPFILGFYLYYIVQDKDGQKGNTRIKGTNEKRLYKLVKLFWRSCGLFAAAVRSSKLWERVGGGRDKSTGRMVRTFLHADPTECLDTDIHTELRNYRRIQHPTVSSWRSRSIGFRGRKRLERYDETFPLEMHHNLLSIKIIMIFFYFSALPYKHTHLDVDLNNRSDRIEWGHLRYQSTFRTDNSYELVVQWVASSGSIVADLVSSSSTEHAQVERNTILLFSYKMPFFFPFLSRFLSGNEKLNCVEYKWYRFPAIY